MSKDECPTTNVKIEISENKCQSTNVKIQISK
jgi:hypothetical protein